MTNPRDIVETYRPRLVLNRPLEGEQLSQVLATVTGSDAEIVDRLLLALSEIVVYFLLQGTPIALDGLGTYYPVVHLDGRLHCGYRADGQVERRLNIAGAYQGRVLNDGHG